MYDVIIIGGGPSGSTLAKTLDEKYKVLIIDKRNLIGVHNKNDINKCCGGLLAPDAQKVLAQMMLGLPKEIIVGPQMFSVETIDFDNGIKKYYQRHYINIDRERFDRWLVSKVGNNVDVMDNAVYLDCQEQKDSYEIRILKDNKVQSLSCRVLIGADGGTSKVRKTIFKENNNGLDYVSIQRWYKAKDSYPHYISIFDKEVTDFYSWIIQKDDVLMLGTAIPKDKNYNKRFELLCAKLDKEGFDLRDCIKKEGTIIKRPRKTRDIVLSKGRVGLIGEAAGFISPSSAEGISYALRSGYAMGKSINKDFDNFGHIYRQKMSTLKLNIFIKNLKAKIMYNSFLRKNVMKTGVLSMDINN